MKHIGYIGNAHINEHGEDALQQMRVHGCETLYKENGKGRKRPQWEAFINELQEGDCAVLLSFDNAFYNFHDMIFFVKFCRKTGIRIVSIADGLDTQDELFPESKTVNTLDQGCQCCGGGTCIDKESISLSLGFPKWSETVQEGWEQNGQRLQ